MGKKQKLVRLRNKIIDDVYKKRWEEVWFYPKHGTIKGWEGAGDVMFVGLNPATANFGGFHDTLYYESLRKFGFQNAHLTDIFKLKRVNKDIDELLKRKDHKKEAKKFLREEIKILNPKIIILFFGHTIILRLFYLYS